MRAYLLSLLSLFCAEHACADLFDLSNPANIPQQGVQVYSSGHYLEANDYTAQKDFSGDWSKRYQPRGGDNIALLNSRVEIGATYNAWRIAGLYRKETVIQSNLDTTNLVYRNRQRMKPSAGDHYDLDLNIEGFEAEGLRLDRAFQFDNISLGAGVSLLRGKVGRVGELGGQAAILANGGYQYQVQMQDSYSKASYDYIRDATPSGNGYSLDFGLKAKLPYQNQLEVVVNDLFGKMYWDNMPYTSMTANSSNVTREADGFIRYNPTLTGFNDVNRRSITQTLQTKVYAQASHVRQNWTIATGVNYLQGYWFPQLMTSYQCAPNWQTSISYDTRFQTVAVGVKHPRFYLQLRSESTRMSESKGYGIAAGLNLTF